MNPCPELGEMDECPGTEKLGIVGVGEESKNRGWHNGLELEGKGSGKGEAEKRIALLADR
jgi:hypothetical protein